jgi:hypothetical protein
MTNDLTQYIETLNWMIADAKRDMAEAARTMARRAAEATQDADALLADGPCSLSWVEFAESDLRNAREAKNRLKNLIEQHKLLTRLAK